MFVCVQRNEAKLNEDVHRLKQENQALEVDLQLLKRERDLAKAQVVSTSGETGCGRKVPNRIAYCPFNANKELKTLQGQCCLWERRTPFGICNVEEL